MRTIVTGVIAFIIWTALCTWFYLTYIKGPDLDKTTAAEETAIEHAPAAADTVPAVIEPEKSIESPGSYTVYHEFDRSEIIPDEGFENYIEQVNAFREQVPGFRMSVTGHTDYIGSENYNYSLGMARSERTRDYLVKEGVPEGVITVSSEGELNPVADNQTDAGRAKNRRTEIQVIKQ